MLEHALVRSKLIQVEPKAVTPFAENQSGLAVQPGYAVKQGITGDTAAAGDGRRIHGPEAAAAPGTGQQLHATRVHPWRMQRERQSRNGLPRR